MVSVAGTYLLHVCLRGPKEALPLLSSPFVLTVAPGHPYGPATDVSALSGSCETGEWRACVVQTHDKVSVRTVELHPPLAI